MRILAANKMDWTHPAAGGVETNLRETLSRLAARGHDVHLLSALHPGAARTATLDGVTVHRTGFQGRTNELAVLTCGQLRFNRLIRTLDPDVLYTVNSLMGWVPLTMRDRHLVAVHHVTGRALLHQYRFPLNLAGLLAERLGLRLARTGPVVTVSPATTRDLVARGFDADRITEIRNGVDTDTYRPGPESDEPTVLYLGRLEHSKGADRLPAIHAAVTDRFGPHRFHIAGTGHASADMAAFADAHDAVTFHGHVPTDRKVELMQQAWLTVVPSRREGWGLTVAEANACGTPAVATDAGGLRHVVQDGTTGRLVPGEFSADAFGRAVAGLLRDDARRTGLAANARSHAEGMDWDDAADALESLLAVVADGRTTAARPAP